MIFSRKMIPFLKENRERNSKEWYNAHREEYLAYVRQPFYELTQQLAPCLYEIDSEIVTEPRYCLCHIYRDTRFSKDKTLYRDNMWLTFKRSSKRWTESPCFYFEVMPDFYRYGMGYYSATPATMAAYRYRIASDPEAFKEAIGGLSTLAPEAEYYKRKFQQECPEDLRDWFLTKNVHVTVSRPIKELYSRNLAGNVAASFREAAPLYKFLLSLKDCPAPSQTPSVPRKTTVDEW